MTRMTDHRERLRELAEGGLARCAHLRLLLDVIEVRLRLAARELPDLLDPALVDLDEARAAGIKTQEIIKQMLERSLI